MYYFVQLRRWCSSKNYYSIFDSLLFNRNLVLPKCTIYFWLRDRFSVTSLRMLNFLSKVHPLDTKLFAKINGFWLLSWREKEENKHGMLYIAERFYLSFKDLVNQDNPNLSNQLNVW